MNLLRAYLILGWLLLAAITGWAIQSLGIDGANVFLSDYLRQGMSGLHTEVDQTKAIFNAAVQTERAERVAELSKLKTQVQEAHVSGLHIAAMGTTWLFVGICLSTASLELSKAIA